jgi:hypothetical protein
MSSRRVYSGLLCFAALGSALGGCAGISSSPTNPAAPTITTQPSNRVAGVGQPATFAVVAAGTPPLTYQWQKAGVNVAGATSSSYTTPATVASDNGATFDVVVTNAAGSVTSAPATLTVTVNGAPAITAQPVSQSVIAGNSVSFTAAASGNPAPTVQWQVSTDGGTTFSNVGGATSTTLTFTAVAGQNGNQYRAVFTNTVGNATTTAATLTVNFAPTVTTNPANQSVTAGNNVSFTAAASGNPAPTVQWQVSTDGGATFSNVGGATSTTLTFTAVAGQNGNQYRAVFTNTVGNATTTAATLTVNTLPSVTTNPSDQTVTAGANASFTAAATGNPVPTVQWQVSTDVGATFNNVTGATSTTLTFTTAFSQNGYEYRAVFTNILGTAMTAASTLTVNTPPVVTTNPVDQTVTAGASVSFTAAASGSPAPTVQWQVSTDVGVTFNNVVGAISTSLTFTTAASQSGYKYRAVFTNTLGTATTTAATLTVNPVSASGTDVTTYHNDVARTGQNITETKLTLANVNSTTFGLLRNITVDGKVDAEPLYLSQLSVSGSVYNVVFIATEHDSVYAFDSDTGAQLWKVSMLGSSEVPSDNRRCGQVTPEIGVTSTPVIDRNAGAHGIMYVVAMSKNGSTYFQRIHALDVTTGAELLGGPVTVQASYSGTTFDPAQYKERPGLLLLNGVIYTTWASHCDFDPYTGWIIGYSASNLTQSSVLNLTPNGSRGAIWQSGGGPAADPQGNIYALVGNGTFETTLDGNGFPVNQDYGNAFVKVSTTGGTLQVADYFNMSNTLGESNVDTDLGSGGPMVLPDLKFGTGSTLLLAVGAGKDGHIYVVDRTNMGKFNSSSNNIYQDLPGAVPRGVWGVPAYFSSTVYYCPQGGTLKSFSISNGMLSGPPAQTAASFTYPGALPSISANGNSNGIVWAIENTAPAVLHAYSASDLTHELYNSNQAPNSRDHFGSGNKFITPMIADGKVFAATTNSVAVFGLL